MKINIRLFLIYAFFFFIPAAYSYPGRIYNRLAALQGYKDFSLFHLILLPSVLFGILFICHRVITKNYQSITINLKTNLLPLTSLFLWFLAASISFAANSEIDISSTTYIATYLSGLLLYFAFINSTLTSKEYLGIFTAIALGSLFPLVLGVIVFFKTWGLFSNAHEFMYAHFDQIKMQPYFQQTFGNTGNTAAFLILITPAIFALLLQNKLSKPLKFLFSVTLSFALLNLLITDSRVAFLTIFIACYCTAYMKSRRCLLIFVIASIYIFGLIHTLAPNFWSLFIERLEVAFTLQNTHEDTSVALRGSAIQTGWNIFLHHFLTGVGPGASAYYNPYTSAHQFNVEQAADLGILGFIASIALCIAIYVRLGILLANRTSPLAYQKFVFIIGPACYITYAIMANVALNIGVINTWIALTCAFLALSEFKLSNTEPTIMTADTYHSTTVTLST